LPWTESDIPDLTGKTAVVTGANGGLGQENARALAAAGATVVVASRASEKTDRAVDELRGSVPEGSFEVVPLDLASLDSVREAASTISAAHPSLDILINNAGVMAVAEAETADGFEMQFGVNHLGHWALTALLLQPLLAAPDARVVTVTSTAHHFGRGSNPDNPHMRGNYKPWRAYFESKLANFQFGLGLQKKFETAGTTASSLIAHPGLSNTDLQARSVEKNGDSTARFFHMLASKTGMSPENGALPQLRAATDPAAKGGEFYGPLWGNNGPPVRKPIFRKIGLDRAVDRLWEVSERETGIPLEVTPS
jgi:NAD(P)-dependent dehydrogenase (short-subunit alcohol dehydrogenase family)